MKMNSPLTICFFLIFYGFALVGCKKQPYKNDKPTMSGYVIGRENCISDESKDFWLIDFTYFPNTEQVGDSITLNGRLFSNVLKLKLSDSAYRIIDKSISVEYTNILPANLTTPCEIANQTLFNLKEMIPLAIGYPGG